MIALICSKLKLCGPDAAANLFAVFLHLAIGYKMCGYDANNDVLYITAC